MRRTLHWPAIFAAASALAACGSDAGGGEADPPAVFDAASGGTPAPPVEDAFVLPDARRDDGALPADSGFADAHAAPLDAAGGPDARGGDAGSSDAGADPLPPAGGLAAGAAPLRSPRYRLFAVVGPAEAAGDTLSSPMYRLESGPTQWLVPPAEPAR